MEVKKLSDNEIEITKTSTPSPTTTVNRYERGFIESQVLAITQQRDALIALKEAELKECTDILKAMNDLGITTKVEVVDEGII